MPAIQTWYVPALEETPDIGEDFLNLRMSRPAGTSSEEKLPMVIWLRSDGVVKDSAYDSHFDPDNLLTLPTFLGKRIIYVTLNYRLTIFGFAPSNPKWLEAVKMDE
ncbi:hypothetical protein DL771_003593 [Monosporascus sp. 5C6A]|nr:hypothetical protein DL771_003593 [Monosporascus sp. 5C6A]